MSPWYRLPHADSVIWRDEERADLEPADEPACEHDRLAPKDQDDDEDADA